MIRSAVIVGGGTMGLASGWALARRGVKVTVLERFGHVHDRGSHGGYTRIIRQAYHEGSGYVPLVQSADAHWRAMEQRAGEPLLIRSGLLEVGRADDPDLGAAIRACRDHAVVYSVLDAAAARKRWPLDIPDDWIACHTPSGGYLRVRACLDAFRREMLAEGGTVREQTRVVDIKCGEADAGVVLEGGEIIHADRVIVTAGAWLPDLLPDLLPGRLSRLRRVLAWTAPAEASVAALRTLPVWGAFTPEGFFYGFPYNDEGVSGFKVALHTAPDQAALDVPVDPERVDRSVHLSDLRPLERFLERYMPQAKGPFVAHSVCLYTATPSWDFVIDRHPEDPRIVIAGAFSGHGFKFAPAIGEVVADLATSYSPPPADFGLARHRGVNPTED
jgi:monomeric sarcosine oxidase